MDGVSPTSPEFRADPLGWVRRMCDRLMAPGVRVSDRDRAFVVRKRERYYPGTTYTPSPILYDQLCRIARRAELLRERPPLRKRGENEAVKREMRPVPPRFALGAPIPPPPPLRRPVVALYDGRTETWDPAGSPGL